VIPDGYRLERGLLWPALDVGAAEAAVRTIGDLEVAYRHCRNFDVAVQAGGNCGVWPAAMGQKFKTVYSFEPDPTNFRCLCANAASENIIKFNAALGLVRRTVQMTKRPDNCGALQVDGAGPIPTMRIDDLELQSCDLIYLDIEGYEMPALQGAKRTIDKFSPVVVVEDKGMSERYGIKIGEIETWARNVLNYRVAEKVNRDLVMVRS
jgi:FkbM family methyltransferase